MANHRIAVRIYRFRVYSLFAGALALLVFLGLIAGTSVLFDTQRYVAQWNGELLKVGMVVLLIGFLFAVRRFISVVVEARIDQNSLSFQALNAPRLFVPLRDQLLMWHEIADWKFTGEHVSGHTWSPPEFRLKMSDGRKLRLYIAGMDGFQPFLTDFERFVAVFNMKNSALPPIESGHSLRQRKKSAVLMLALFIPIAAAAFWLAFQHTQKPVVDWGEAGSAWAIGLLSLVLCGFMARVLFKQKES